MQKMMPEAKYLSRKQKDSIIIIAIGLLLAVLYPILNGDYNDLGKILNSLVIGLFGSSFIVVNEIWFKPSFLRQKKFITLIFYKSLLYTTFFTIIIILVISVQRSVKYDTSLRLIVEQDIINIIIYALVATICFIFIYQISKKMGQGVLGSFIMGKYHRASEEERIFMFIDINDSTQIAESLGDIEYNKLLHDFFFDITESILTNYGEIYRYVGDEVVVSWKLKRGLPHAKFIRTFFQAKRAIRLRSEHYLEMYGLVPKFTAGFNYGKVIVGEIGDVKSQICFFGDVLYETGELEKCCKKFNTDNIIAQSLLNLVDLPQIFSAVKQGEVPLLGLAKISVSSITEV